ncbi:hypothetical protein B9Z19DRAFT_1107482 [Tuber borchii]|uniref:Uncharacterized protein n=1 Tax=Tuber borchii TaxID=42251 RepID=A0A2T6ZW79_TUBBO|nr:hypothetical protein B9Z19DRAFT_1107482 [Tuber borchii]
MPHCATPDASQGTIFPASISYLVQHSFSFVPKPNLQPPSSTKPNQIRQKPLWIQSTSIMLQFFPRLQWFSGKGMPCQLVAVPIPDSATKSPIVTSRPKPSNRPQKQRKSTKKETATGDADKLPLATNSGRSSRTKQSQKQKTNEQEIKPTGLIILIIIIIGSDT